MAACKYREFTVKSEISDPVIFCRKKPFGELFSKIANKLLQEFSFSGKPLKNDCVTSAVTFWGKLLHVQTVLTAGCLTTSKPSSTPLKNILFALKKCGNISAECISTGAFGSPKITTFRDAVNDQKLRTFGGKNRVLLHRISNTNVYQMKAL